MNRIIKNQDTHQNHPFHNPKDLMKNDSRNKGFLFQSTLALALCVIASACALPGAPNEEDDLPELDQSGAQLAEEPAPMSEGDWGDAASGLVHETPKVPVVIDGVRYAPEDIHLFDGRPLYMIVDLTDPGVLVGFTKQSDFQVAVDAKKAALDSITPQAAGQYTDYFSDDECRGDRLTVYSAWGINYLGGVARGCGIFGCAGYWNDVISSLWVNGSQHIYTDAGYSGNWLWVGGWGCVNMSTYGFDNLASSLNVWW
jgi:hypothetical protein